MAHTRGLLSDSTLILHSDLEMHYTLLLLFLPALSTTEHLESQPQSYAAKTQLTEQQTQPQSFCNLRQREMRQNVLISYRHQHAVAVYSFHVFEMPHMEHRSFICCD